MTVTSLSPPAAVARSRALSIPSVPNVYTPPSRISVGPRVPNRGGGPDPSHRRPAPWHGVVVRGATAFGPREVPHSFTVGPDRRAHELGSSRRAASTPLLRGRRAARNPDDPPAHVLPPENVAAIAVKHDKKLL
jgi:hypothetical protein